ncbi:MAG: aldehyde dehydrogenase family protein [Planctomycetota bacterium]
MTTAAPSSTDTIVSTNPATGEVVGSVPVTPAGEVGAVIARAHAAQRAWGEVPLAERADRLRGLVAAIDAEAEAIAELITREQGKPLAEAKGEVSAVTGGLNDELDEIVEALSPEVRESEGVRSTVYRDPIGVVGAITPWNFPMLMPQWMVLPALAAGNAVVLKPSDVTPLVAQRYAEALMPLLPEGVLQVVHGGDDQGKALVAGDIDLVAFTGSREAGRAIMAAASSGLKRLILELGSKDPLIVLEDADVEAAADFAASNSYRNCGQVCVSTERVYVHRAIAEPFVDRLLAKTAEVAVGDGMAEGTTMGPMVSAEQRDHVRRQIDDARRRGADVRIDESQAPSVDGAHFLAPTVILNGDHAMDINRVETFGPVASVMVVADDDEALRLANDSDLGLGGVVFGQADHAERVGRRLNVGMVGINKSIGSAAGCPWVGARQSGYGYHQGPDGHRQFCQTRVVSTSA